jgi:hypothetical protein
VVSTPSNPATPLARAGRERRRPRRRSVGVALLTVLVALVVALPVGLRACTPAASEATGVAAWPAGPGLGQPAARTAVPAWPPPSSTPSGAAPSPPPGESPTPGTSWNTVTPGPGSPTAGPPTPMPAADSPSPTPAPSLEAPSAAPPDGTPAPTAPAGTPVPPPAFGITGDVVGLLPGQWTTIRLTVTNPKDVDLRVTSLTVTVAPDSTPPGCPSASNLRVVQSAVSADIPLTVPAGGSVTLDEAPLAPQVVLLDLPDVNQNACQGVTFALRYGGSAEW